MDTFQFVRKFYDELYNGKIQSSSFNTICGFQYLRSLGYREDILSSLWDFPWELVYPCGCPVKYPHLTPDSKVLSIGSGIGLDSFYIIASFPEYRGLLVNLDISTVALLNSKKWAEKFSERADSNEGSKISWICGNAVELPFRNKTFDIVIINGMFNISLEKENLLRETARITKTDGTVMIADLFLKRKLPSEVSSDPAALVWCVAGALTAEEMENYALKNGFNPPFFHERETIDDVFYRAVCSLTLKQT